MINISELKIKRVLFCISIIMGILMLTCCMRNPHEITISNKSILLTSEPIKFKLDEVIYRNREIASILLNLAPYILKVKKGVVMLADGRKGAIEVVLTDNRGIKYKANYYGTVGDSFSASFSHLKKNVKISTIEISSSIEILCSRVYWYCFDPI